MLEIIHTRTSETPREWEMEDQYRYWNWRRSELKRRGILISESTESTPTRLVRREVWVSRNEYERSRSDTICRVIESVVLNVESQQGVRIERTEINIE